MIRESIQQLSNMGNLPSQDNPDIELIKKYQELLDSIQSPVSDEEASVLASIFGKDECFGLAWTLLHIIESAQNICIESENIDRSNPWIILLQTRRTNKS